MDSSYLIDIPWYVPVIAVAVLMAVLFFALAIPTDAINRVLIIFFTLGVLIAILYFFSPLGRTVKNKFVKEEEPKEGFRVENRFY